MTAQDSADSGRRDLVAELEELALDAAIAPTWVLAAQTQNQVAQLIRDWRPASPRAQAEGGPMLAHKLPMPAEQRGGREEQAPRWHLMPSAARIIRSAGSRSGRLTCRRRTATWWRRATISRSRSASELLRKTAKLIASRSSI